MLLVSIFSTFHTTRSFATAFIILYYIFGRYFLHLVGYLLVQQVVVTMNSFMCFVVVFCLKSLFLTPSASFIAPDIARKCRV